MNPNIDFDSSMSLSIRPSQRKIDLGESCDASWNILNVVRTAKVSSPASLSYQLLPVRDQSRLLEGASLDARTATRARRRARRSATASASRQPRRCRRRPHGLVSPYQRIARDARPPPHARPLRYRSDRRPIAEAGRRPGEGEGVDVVRRGRDGRGRGGRWAATRWVRSRVRPQPRSRTTK